MRILFTILILVTIWTHGHANGGHHDGEDGKDGKDGIDGVDGIDGTNGVVGLNGVNGLDGSNGIDSSNLYTGIASSFAMSNLDFSSSTTQWQVGAAMGGYGGQEAWAMGAAKLIPKYDVLIKFSGTRSNSHTGYGVGFVWKIK